MPWKSAREGWAPGRGTGLESGRLPLGHPRMGRTLGEEGCGGEETVTGGLQVWPRQSDLGTGWTLGDRGGQSDLGTGWMLRGRQGQKGAGDRGGEGSFLQGLPGDRGGESSLKTLSPCVRGKDRMWE